METVRKISPAASRRLRLLLDQKAQLERELNNFAGFLADEYDCKEGNWNLDPARGFVQIADPPKEEQVEGDPKFIGDPPRKKS